MDNVIDIFLRKIHRDELAATAHSPAYQAYQMLHWAFVAVPLITGFAKFAGALTDWDNYLAPAVARHVPFSSHFSSQLVLIALGLVEIAAGLITLVKPRIGAYIVAAWLLAIIGNLLLLGGHLDVVLRDFGLCLAALALGRLSVQFDTKSITSARGPSRRSGDLPSPPVTSRLPTSEPSAPSPR